MYEQLIRLISTGVTSLWFEAENKYGSFDAQCDGEVVSAISVDTTVTLDEVKLYKTTQEINYNYWCLQHKATAEKKVTEVHAHTL